MFLKMRMIKCCDGTQQNGRNSPLWKTSSIQLDKDLSNLTYIQSYPCFEQGPPKVPCSFHYSATPHTTQMRDSRSAETERE